MKHEKGELRFQCVTCTARFRCRSSLNRHMLTHLKPYKCDQCEEKFKTPKKLARHIGRLSILTQLRRNGLYKLLFRYRP